MEYALRVYAAIYGHRVVPGNSSEKARLVVYGSGDDPEPHQDNYLRIPALYQPRQGIREIRESMPHFYAGEAFCLFFGIDPQSGRPDWLGEIFRWLSSEN